MSIFYRVDSVLCKKHPDIPAEEIESIDVVQDSIGKVYYGNSNVKDVVNIIRKKEYQKKCPCDISPKTNKIKKLAKNKS